MHIQKGVHMHENLTKENVSFPQYWDEAKVLEALSTLEGIPLREYFGCNNPTSFTRLMKPCFPNRPEKMSYSNYVRKLLS